MLELIQKHIYIFGWILLGAILLSSLLVSLFKSINNIFAKKTESWIEFSYFPLGMSFGSILGGILWLFLAHADKQIEENILYGLISGGAFYFIVVLLMLIFSIDEEDSGEFWGIAIGFISGGILGWNEGEMGGLIILGFLGLGFGALTDIAAIKSENIDIESPLALATTGPIACVIVGIIAYLFGLGFLVILWLSCFISFSIIGHFVALIYKITYYISELLSKLLIKLFIILTYREIICNHCYRYSEPLKSRYASRIRYCEHCGNEVEKTKDKGIVIYLFGNISVKKAKRKFVLINPDFNKIDGPKDVSLVYIDSKTADNTLIERFITHITANHPPTNGLKSVQIICKGRLADLGVNLSQLLRNHFVNIKFI